MRPLLSGCGALCLFAAGGSLLAYLATAALAITGSPDALSFAVLSGAGALLLAGAGTVLLHAGLSDAAGGAATFGARAERSAARMPLARVRPMTWLLAFGFVLLAGQATLSVAPQVAGFVLPPLHFAAALLPALAMTSRIAKQPRFYALAFGGCGAATVSLVLEALVAGVVGALLFAGLNTTEEGRQAIESVRLGLAGAADAGGAGGTVDPTALDIEWLLPLLTRPMVIVGIFGLVGVIGPLIEEAVKSSYVAVRRPVSVGTAWWWGIAAGAGFGVTEATALGAMGVGAWATAMIVRSSATLMHATMTGVAAVGWHRALVERNRRGGAALLVVAAVGHMAWNALVLLAALAGLDVGSGSEGWSGVAVLASGGGIGVLLVAVLLLYAAGSARFGRRGTWYTPGSTSDGGRPMTADERARAPIDKARSEQTDATGRLLKFLRIPSVSAVPERAPDMQRAAQWVADRLTSAGATDVRIDATPGHPVVYARAAGPPGAPTVLVYGHYDVQPTDPDELWDSPPFEPTIRDGNVYARGASDDKGQVLIHLEALSAFTSTEGRPPVTLKYVIEGEEEIGSPNLEPWLEDHAQELAADVAVISDTAMLAPGQPSIVYGLRGLAYIEVEFTGPQRDLHSGQFGGAVRNPAHALARVIGQLHDSEGRITVPHFYDRVQPLGREERELLSRVPFDQASYEQTAGVAGGWGEAGYSVVERLGARPTLDVNGMWSGWTGPGAKTVLPAKASAKISMRLVPDQDPEEIADLCGEHIRHLAGPGVTVEIQRLHSARPAVVDRDLPAIRAAVEGYEAAFGKAPVFSREGGSIPVVASLEEVLGLSTVLMGFGLPDDNLHAPNEKFHLDNFHRGMEAVIVLLQALGQEAA